VALRDCVSCDERVRLPHDALVSTLAKKRQRPPRERPCLSAGCGSASLVVRLAPKPIPCVLPGGLHRIRHYGLLANAGRREHLARARELLHVVPAAIESPPPVAPVAAVQPTFVCPHCGAAMIIVQIFARAETIRAPPTWRVAA
jgi:hypothetical protein